VIKHRINELPKCDSCWFLMVKPESGMYCKRLHRPVDDVADDECSFDGVEVCGDPDCGGPIFISKQYGCYVKGHCPDVCPCNDPEDCIYI